MKIRAFDAAIAADARVVRAEALPERFAVATDTRTLAPGDAFVALRGERFDGHAFVGEAVERGAAALVVADDAVVPPGVPALVVADTTRAYLAFGRVARATSAARLCAITGSAGKTTTKALLAQLLERAAPGRVAATVANENNEIGVAKLLLAVPPDAAYVVAELGARRPGEIAPLAAAAAPDVAVLTNVGDAHLEIMGSPKALADTKWGIFSTGARPVLGAIEPVARARAATLPHPARWFALDDEAAALARRADDEIVTLRGRETLEVSAGGSVLRYACTLAVPGDHNRRNAAAAAAAALALGLGPAAVALGLAALELPPGRYERIACGGFTVLYDAYNASMSGTLATLESFGREAAPRRIAVLASMAELGADAPAMHERVGAAAVAASELVLVGGEHGADLARGALTAGAAPERIVPFADNAAASAWLQAHARPGDLVLLKGSRRYRLEEIVDALREATVHV